jgi:hypothetical protein
MKKAAKSKVHKRPKTRAKGFTIGLAGFAKISAIEGLHLTRDMRTTFRTLKRNGASHQQRRAAIVRKYGTAS